MAERDSDKPGKSRLTISAEIAGLLALLIAAATFVGWNITKDKPPTSPSASTTPVSAVTPTDSVSSSVVPVPDITPATPTEPLAESTSPSSTPEPPVSSDSDYPHPAVLTRDLPNIEPGDEWDVESGSDLARLRNKFHGRVGGVGFPVLLAPALYYSGYAPKQAWILGARYAKLNASIGLDDADSPDAKASYRFTCDGKVVASGQAVYGKISNVDAVVRGCNRLEATLNAKDGDSSDNSYPSPLVGEPTVT